MLTSSHFWDVARSQTAHPVACRCGLRTAAAARRAFTGSARAGNSAWRRPGAGALAQITRDIAIGGAHRHLGLCGSGAGDIAAAAGKSGFKPTIVRTISPYAAASGSLSSTAAVGTGSYSQAGTTTSTTPFKGVGVFNNAVVIGNAGTALAGTTLTGASTGSGKLSVALGADKYVHH